MTNFDLQPLKEMLSIGQEWEITIDARGNVVTKIKGSGELNRKIEELEEELARVTEERDYFFEKMQDANQELDEKDEEIKGLEHTLYLIEETVNDLQECKKLFKA